MNPRRPVALLATAAALLVGCGDDEGASPEATAPPAPSTTVAPTPDTADDLARVLIAGDSVLAEVAGPLAAAIEATGRADAEFVLGPDLPRDAADEVVWRDAVARYQPDLVVVSVGHWEYLQVLGDFADGDLLVPGTYPREVLDPFVDLVTEHGARVLWVGPAVIEDGDEAEFVDGLEADFEALAERRSEVDFVDADAWVAPDGFTPTLPGPDGAPVPVRRTDGIHLCPEGQILLAEGLLGVIAADLGLDAAPGWADAWRAEQAPEPGGCARDYQGG